MEGRPRPRGRNELWQNRRSGRGLSGPVSELKQALATYTESGGTGQTAVDKGEAIALMLEKHEVCVDMLHGFDFTAWATGTPAERLGLLPVAQEHILAQEDGKDRFVAALFEPGSKAIW